MLVSTKTGELIVPQLSGKHDLICLELVHRQRGPYSGSKGLPGLCFKCQAFVLGQEDEEEADHFGSLPSLLSRNDPLSICLPVREFV